MKWGIIGAMPSEIALLKAQMVDAKEEIVSGLTYQSGKIRGKDVVLCCSEIGKVNAAMCAQTLALRYHVDYMINTGGRLHLRRSERFRYRPVPGSCFSRL